MVLSAITNCNKCNVRIPKHHPKLYCTICNEIKHFRCQELSKTEARHIIESHLDWICYECISSILPVNACTIRRNNQSSSLNPRYKIRCSYCSGYSYSPSNTRICDWCNCTVHVRCHRIELGCLKCCESIIPGYHVSTYELHQDYSTLNKLIYNPYERHHFTNQIGEAILNEENHNTAWNEISDILVNCQYKQQKHVKMSTPSQLKIFSMNIRSLSKNISHLRENIDVYSKYDIICLNETNCVFKKLANGMNDLIIEGFHEPLVQDPIRSSGRGGGLALYINKRVADTDKIEIFSPNPDPSNTCGEFQFVKIHQCKGFNRTKIIGNVYRSPSRVVDSFNKHLESILQNLGRHSKKHITVVGDFNIDLIKHDNNLACQNLIDTTSNYGFVQIISRPTRITDHSATLLDHVYSNNIDDTISSNIITTDVSDHLATLTTINLDNTASSPYRVAINKASLEKSETRIFNEANNLHFKQLINEEDWNGVLDRKLDAQAQFLKFNDIYNRHYNNAYPLKINRIRRKHERLKKKKWILPWLEEAIARKENLYHVFVKNNSEKNSASYKK